MVALDRWERLCLALIAGGVILRFSILPGHALDADAAWYVTMGKTLSQRGEFIVPWESPLKYTWHFPPLFPAWESAFLALFGPTFLAVKIASATAGILFIGVVFFCTRSLYGRSTAFAVTAVAATLPTLFGYDILGMSETFVAMLFALTVWGILKSLDDPRFIVLAGLFAGLGYLAKASMGPFFLLAGGAGFLWRFYYVRWKVLRDKWYLLGASVFALLVIPWALRNIARHGWPHWETQVDAQEALNTLFSNSSWPATVALAGFWAGLLLFLHALPFFPGLRSTWKDIGSEKTSGLLMAIVTPLLVSGFFIAAFSVREGYQILTSEHPLRYAITPIVPLLWLTMRSLDWSSPAPAGEPTAGAHLPKREAAFVVVGSVVIALSLALRWPWFELQRVFDLILLAVGIIVGMIILAASRSQAWEATTRLAAGQLSWRAVRRKTQWAAALLAVPLFIAAFLLTQAMLPLVLAGAAACLVATWRYRAIVVAFVFLGWAIGGVMWAWPVPDAESGLASLAHPGDTVALMPGIEPWLYPFLPSSVSVVPWSENATYRVQDFSIAAPENYTEVGVYWTNWDQGIGATARLWIEGQFVDVSGIHGPPQFRLFERNATASVADISAS